MFWSTLDSPQLPYPKYSNRADDVCHYTYAQYCKRRSSVESKDDIGIREGSGASRCWATQGDFVVAIAPTAFSLREKKRGGDAFQSECEDGDGKQKA